MDFFQHTVYVEQTDHLKNTTGEKFKFWVGLLDHATKKPSILGLKSGMGLLDRWA